MIRREARETIARWREVLIGAAALLLGGYWMATAFGLLAWIGIPLALGGVALIWAGVQRARFRQGGGGPGVVSVVEGRISYFGPLTGGTADLGEISRLRVDHSSFPPHWVLEQPGEPPLFVPTNAEGAEALFDAFATLPGLETGRMVAAMTRRAQGSVAVWQRGKAPAPLRRLH
ncbi:MAG: hypothetical protein KDK26_06675 [Roseivivax sp.]|nr:hypothetical protein [Roseivivax sp.]